MASHKSRVRLDSIATLRVGSGFPERFQGLKSGVHPFIKVSDLDRPGNGRQIVEAENWLDNARYKELRPTLHPAGAIVFAKVGAALMLNRRRILSMPTAIDNNMMSVEARTGYPGYLYALMQNLDLGKICQGGGLPSVNQEVLGEQLVYVPQLIEQRRIAAVLDTWDDAIGTAERLLDLRSREIAGASERLFRACFEPGPSRGWLRVRLADAFRERDERGGGGRLLSITAEQGIVYREEVGRKDTSTEDKSTYKRIYPGDIGYNTMRMWQGVSALSRLEGLVSPAYTVVTPYKYIDGQFAAHLFKQPRMIDRFWRYSQGLVDDTLNLKFPHFAQIVVNLPATQYQQESAALLDNLSEAVSKEKLKTALLRRQKRGLMLKLLTGEWRVPATSDIFAPGGPAADQMGSAA